MIPSHSEWRASLSPPQSSYANYKSLRFAHSFIHLPIKLTHLNSQRPTACEQDPATTATHNSIPSGNFSRGFFLLHPPPHRSPAAAVVCQLTSGDTTKHALIFLHTSHDNQINESDCSSIIHSSRAQSISHTVYVCVIGPTDRLYPVWPLYQ